MFIVKIFTVTVLILTGHKVWTKYIPTTLEGDFDYDVDEAKDYDDPSDTKLVTVVVVRNSLPKSDQYSSYETSKEYLPENQVQNTIEDTRIVERVKNFNIFDYIDFDDENEGELELQAKNEKDPFQMLRKKKKRKKSKKYRTCKSVCKTATKSVCKKFKCSKKKKKSIAKACYKKCKKNHDDDD